MTPTVSLVPAGMNAQGVQPGDIIAVHRPGPVRAVIRAGQWVRPSLRPWAAFTHIACVRWGGDGLLVEAVWPRVRKAWLDEYQERDYLHISTGLTGEQRIAAMRYLDRRVGCPYALLGDLGTAVRLATPWDGPWFTGRSDSIDCSGMAAEMLERGPYDWPVIAAAMCPAEVVRDLGVPADWRTR